MKERREVLDYGMTFQDVYIDTPFHDPNTLPKAYSKAEDSASHRIFCQNHSAYK